MSSSRPKSTLVDGGLLSEEFSSGSAILLCDIIDEESVTAGEDTLFIRAAMPLGLMRRRSGDRSAKPDAEGRFVAIMATMDKIVTELRRR